MINNKFLYGLASLMAGSSYDVPSHLAFGSDSDTITASDVITSGEFDRNALDYSEATSNTVKFVGGRSSGEADNDYINVIGLHNAATLASSDNLQANFLVPSLLHTSAFDLNVELWVTFNRV